MTPSMKFHFTFMSKQASLFNWVKKGEKDKDKGKVNGNNGDSVHKPSLVPSEPSEPSHIDPSNPTNQAPHASPEDVKRKALGKNKRILESSDEEDVKRSRTGETRLHSVDSVEPVDSRQVLAHSKHVQSSSQPYQIETPVLKATKAKAKPNNSNTPRPSQTPLNRIQQLQAYHPSSEGEDSDMLTEAERSAQSAKSDSKSNETPFSFLIDPRDKQGKPRADPDYDPRTLFIPPQAWRDFKPFERQFWEIKQNHFDCVLFFQKGKFFELYEDDARIGHQQFDLKLTDRVRMAMVGVPEARLEHWVARFLAAGYKVGKVEQCETALGAQMAAKNAVTPKADALVRRELRSVFTNGTLVDGLLLSEDDATHCVCIRQDGTDFGLTILDAATAEFTLAHAAHSHHDAGSLANLETILRQVRPKEIVHEIGNLDAHTLRLLRNIVPLNCVWTKIRAADVSNTDTVLSSLTGEDGLPDAVEAFLPHHVTIQSLACMLAYLHQLNLDKDLVTMRHFNIFDHTKAGQAMEIDGRTLAHLEILLNSDGDETGTLLNLLNHTRTPSGKRLFRTWLCTPLRHPDAINGRLDAVETIMQSDSIASIFKTMTTNLGDLERLLSRIHANALPTTQFVRVLDAFDQLSTGFLELAQQIANLDYKAASLQTLLTTIPDTRDLIRHIRNLFTLKDDLVVPNPGADDTYDENEQVLENLQCQLESYLPGYAEELGIARKDICYVDKGTVEIYSIEVAIEVEVPRDWQSLSKTTKVARYYSPDVKRDVQALKEARETRTALIKEFKTRIYAEFDRDFKMWLKVVKGSAELDCLISLARASAQLSEPVCRPSLVHADQACFSFSELRHPGMAERTDFIANDVELGGDKAHCMLLTGPNMAGKSTLLRTTAIGCLMAQLGMLVPAKTATIAPLDRIVSRIGAYDNMFEGQSTFLVEMNETAKILTEATRHSFVILDELGRGTSTTQGIAIAGAVLHAIATHVGACCIFSTHYANLADDFVFHPEILPKHMDVYVDEERREIIFKYKLVDGCALGSYGHHVAKLAGVPDAVTIRAEAIGKESQEATKAMDANIRKSPVALSALTDLGFLLETSKALAVRPWSLEVILQSFQNLFELQSLKYGSINQNPHLYSIQSDQY